MPESASERPEPERYRALLELGEGGAAKVYLAATRDEPAGLVVLKALKAHLANEPELVAMFQAEAKLSQKLHHPNIVRVLEVIQSHKTPVIVMEYLEGRALSEIVQRAGDALTLEQHLFVIAKALDGLHYSHELTDASGAPLGVVHRDMTPHNLFVTCEGKVRLLDFGIAKVNASGVETDTGVIKGKVRYMAPEQISGEAIDRRADVFSVGVMLWEAAARTKLWRGVSDTQVMSRVIDGEIPVPSSVRSCPPALEAVIKKALALAPADRYASIRELHEDLLAAVPELAEVSEAELGASVRGWFAKEIAELQRAVATRLGDPDSNADNSGKLTLPPRVFSAKPPAKPNTLGKAWFPLTLSLLVAWVVWASLRRDAPPRTSAPAPAEAERSVHVTAFPAEAKLWIDGQPLAENPAVLRLKAGTTHLLRVEAQGHQPAERSFVADRALVVTLAKLPPPGPSSSGTSVPKPRPTPSAPRLAASAPSSQSVPSAATASAPVPAAPACDPPYFFDARGVKKYKPECL